MVDTKKVAYMLDISRQFVQSVKDITQEKSRKMAYATYSVIKNINIEFNDY